MDERLAHSARKAPKLTGVCAELSLWRMSYSSISKNPGVRHSQRAPDGTKLRMNLLREIRAAAIDVNVDVVTLLRKARVLAFDLGNPEFESWVQNELNGYSKVTALPSYRTLRVEAKAHLVFGYRELKNAPVMASQVPEKYRHLATTSSLCAAISVYAALIAGPDTGNGTALQAPWPQEIAVKYAGRGYVDAQCLGAWQVLGRNQIFGVIDSVKNRILEFVLQIERAAPELGEGEPTTGSIPPEKVTQIFNTYVMGNVTNLSSGNGIVSQTSTDVVPAGDLAVLLSVLKRGGIPETDVEELSRVLQSESDAKSASDGWLRKLAIAAGKTVTESAIVVASKALSEYLRTQM